MVQDLQTAEAEIDTLDNEIRDIEFGIQTATDADEDVWKKWPEVKCGPTDLTGGLAKG